MTADDLLALAEGDPRRAISAGRKLLDAPVAEQSLRERARTLHAVGLAERTLGDIPRSVAALEQATDVAMAADDPQLLGEIELTLAASVAFGGDMARAFELLDAANSRLDELGRAQVAVQRAGFVARSGDFARCLALYAEAEPVLEDLDDARSLALLSANRGLVQVYLGELDAAAHDLERARDLYEQLGRRSSSAEMVHNLGFLALRRGDIPAALEAFDDAEQQFRALDIPLSELLLDRSEAHLLVGLAAEARDIAHMAITHLTEAGLDIERSEALLAHARAALAAGDPDAAASSARTAEELMALQGRPGWRMRAQYLYWAAAAGAGTALDRRELTRIAADLEATGQIVAAFHTRLLAGRDALRAGDDTVAAEELARAGDVPRFAPVDLRVQAWLARALLRQSQGRPGAAATAVAAGVRLLDSYRATLGATESRVNVARHAVDLFRLGLRLAHDSGRPSRVLDWIERSHTGSLRLVRPIPPEDDRLAEALVELRAVQRDVREAEVEGEFSPDMWREQARLERQVRQVSLRAHGSTAPAKRAPTLRDLQQRLDGRTMAVYAAIDGEMVAVRVRPRSIRMFPLGPAAVIQAQADRMRRAHRSLALARSGATANASRRALEDAAASLGTVLLSPLRLDGDDLVIVPPAALHSLPWPALPQLDRRTLVIAPSAFAWHRAESAADRAGPTVLVAGPGLEHAEAEVSEIAALHRDPIVLTGAAATVAAVLDALGEAAIAHFAGHARFRSDNAMFSSLVLADGELTVYELERVGRAPDLVILSACDSGLSEAAAGEELMGLTMALVALGTRSLIAATSPVPDAEPTRALMAAFHEHLLRGTGPAASIAAARAHVKPGHRIADVTRDAFFCFGS